MKGMKGIDRMKGTKGTGEVIQFKNKGRALAPFWEEYRKQRIGNRPQGGFLFSAI
jgi:hypothetical protein